MELLGGPRRAVDLTFKGRCEVECYGAFWVEVGGWMT